MILTLVEKIHLVDNVWAFLFTPSEPLGGIAGQYVQVELPHANADAEGTKRWFTNSAAPYQGILQITTRITESTFKHTLAKLEQGSTELQLLAKPEGDFVWQEGERPLVFIAGGIGVTPFYSMLAQRAHDGQPLNVTLIYGSRTVDVPFKAELDQWASQDAGLQIHYAVGTPLTAESLTELVLGLNDALVYLSGPEPMVETLGDDLKNHGLAESQLKQGFFPNYNDSTY